jgi:hypothetical protein
MLKTILLCSLLGLHPIHMSMTTITQAPGSDSMKVFFRMFYDDFLRDYKLFDPVYAARSGQGAIEVNEDQMGRYFREKVHIYINNKLLDGKITATAHDNFEISITLQFKSLKLPGSFKIRNRVLTGLYSDQENMIYIEIDNYHEAIRLTPDHDTEKRKLK